MPKQSEFTLDDDTKFIVGNWATMTPFMIAESIGRTAKFVKDMAKSLTLGNPYNPEAIDGILPKKNGVYWRKTKIPGIIVSEEGDIWDTIKGRCPALIKMDNGYLATYVVRDGVTHKACLANLVYESFKGPLPEWHHVIHSDGIQANDDIENLTVMSDRDIARINKSYEDKMRIRKVAALDRFAQRCLENSEVKPKSIFMTGETVNVTFIPQREIKHDSTGKVGRDVGLYVDGNLVKIYRSAASYANEKMLKLFNVVNKLNNPNLVSRTIKDDIRWMSKKG
jgi:hypothetical protein